MTHLRCYYCDLEGTPAAKGTLAYVTLHDRRGCKHVCMKHAEWRFTTSWAGGHSPDCLVGAALALEAKT
jgi:hypothetical protein